MKPLTKRLSITLDGDNQSSLRNEKVNWLMKKNIDMSYSKLINKAIREYYKMKEEKK